MRISWPSYYKQFQCIADRCPDSCCKEWDVLVDSETAAFYRGLSGSLGDRLRSVMHEEDGETYMTIEDGRCPMWRKDGLCRIQAELGHDALCKTCRDFPRLTHDYGSFIEHGLELSCPEAARLILSSPIAPFGSEESAGQPAPPEYDREVMEMLLSSRKAALSLLQDPKLAPNEALAVVLFYGYHVQAQIDGEEAAPFSPTGALQAAKDLHSEGSIEEILSFFRQLELLTPQWKDRLFSPCIPSAWEERHRKLAAYFIERYWLQAISDLDLVCRVKLMVISCILIRYLGGDLPETAQLYSKEIENDPDNVDSILDAAYAHRAFTDDKLLWLLLEG